jgi:transposase-like protein
MDMIAVINRIEARINELRSSGRAISERSVSVEATGSPDTIRNWRRAAQTGKKAGATTIKLQQVASALGVTPEWLMIGDTQDNDTRALAIAEILALLRELEPEELEMLRAAAEGVHARRHKAG